MSKAPQGVEAGQRERERGGEESGKIYPSGALKFYDSIMRVAAIQFQLRFSLCASPSGGGSGVFIVCASLGYCSSAAQGGREAGDRRGERERGGV